MLQNFSEKTLHKENVITMIGHVKGSLKNKWLFPTGNQVDTFRRYILSGFSRISDTHPVHSMVCLTAGLFMRKVYYAPSGV